MRVIGIDPGSQITGYGIIEKNGNSIRHIDNGGIRPKSDMPLAVRLTEIYAGIKKIVEEHRPTVAVIENLFFAKNAKSSLILGHARGVAMLALSEAGIEIQEYSPLEVKQAITGHGRATKEQVQHMVKVMLNLPEPAFEDASDALAVAICHANASGLKDSIAKASGGVK